MNRRPLLELAAVLASALLGVLHGWLGACFHRRVLARDPWAALLSALS